MIPDFQSLMLALLKRLADKQEHKFRNLVEKLAQYMIDYGIGVSTVNMYELKKVDGDYFGEE
jgi:restriction endonuclease Mrr